MPSTSYLVTFYKTLPAHYGPDREVSQRVIEVQAADEHLALQQAKDEFCRLERLPHWTHHADRVELRPKQGGSGRDGA